MGNQFENVLLIKKCEVCGEFNHKDDQQCIYCHGLFGEGTVVKEAIERKISREFNRFVWLVIFPLFLFLVGLYPRFIMIFGSMFDGMGGRLPGITQSVIDYSSSAIDYMYIYIIVFGILIGLFYTFKKFFYNNVVVRCRQNEALVVFLLGGFIGFTVIALFMPILTMASNL